MLRILCCGIFPTWNLFRLHLIFAFLPVNVMRCVVFALLCTSTFVFCRLLESFSFNFLTFADTSPSVDYFCAPSASIYSDFLFSVILSQMYSLSLMMKSDIVSIVSSYVYIRDVLIQFFWPRLQSSPVILNVYQYPV